MLAISVLLGVTCPFILEFASCCSATKRAMCQQLAEQYMTEISSLYSLGKIILLTNIIPICDVLCAKRLSCIILYTFGLLRVKLYA
jgi:hypothetical protein